MNRLLQKIKEDQLVARKSKDSVRSKLLTTLIGEAVMVGKNCGNRESTEEEILSTIRSFLKQANEFIKISPNEESVREIEILKNYLPKQLSDNRMVEIINSLVASGETNMGKIMAHFKNNFSNQYDGRQLSILVKKGLR